MYVHYYKGEQILSNIQIKYLSEVPQYIPTLAQWYFDQWGKNDTAVSTLEKCTAILKTKLKTSQLPLTFVAIVDDQAVGTVSLLAKTDVNGFEDRKLWLSTFFVHESYRRRGIGKELLNQAYSKGRELGLAILSTFVVDTFAGTFCDSYGWRQIAPVSYQNNSYLLIEREL